MVFSRYTLQVPMIPTIMCTVIYIIYYLQTRDCEEKTTLIIYSKKMSEIELLNSNKITGLPTSRIPFCRKPIPVHLYTRL